MRKICVVTGTRAEYGLLKPVIQKIKEDAELELYLIVTGAHLSTEFGLTYKEIENDGYTINKKIEMLISADTPSGIVKSMGVEMIGFAEVFETERPDMIVILGDRYEMLVAAAAAMTFRIPIAHIHGGETTEGAIDEAIRHAITKMSYLHFASTEKYVQRIIQLGENPDRVFDVGALGVENARRLQLLTKEELEKDINFKFSENTAMVTYHPVTLEDKKAERQFECILNVLQKRKDMRIIFTKANSDAGGRAINKKIDEFVSNNRERSISFASMGQLRYLSSLQYCSVVMGNSSSGIVEAPSFGIPTIDIGDRQKGRVCSKTVIHCKTAEGEIERAVEKAFDNEFRRSICDARNPYEGLETSKRIVEVIKEHIEYGIELKKKFYDV